MAAVSKTAVSRVIASSHQEDGSGGEGESKKSRDEFKKQKELEEQRKLGNAPAGMATNSIFLFPFCEKSLICLEGKSITPHRGNTILFRSSQQLTRLRLGPSKGFLS